MNLAVCRRSILIWHRWGCQVGEEEDGAGREWQACFISGPGRGVLFHVEVSALLFSLQLTLNLFQVTTRLEAMELRSVLLRRRPLRAIRPPPPTVLAESQWGELRRRAFGTCARVAGS
jgi:hypothetical protein